MSVLVIRAHKRFAVRRTARLRLAGRRGHEGLLIELSLDGCRLSNLPPQAFALDQTVTLRLEGHGALEGRVRWLSDGTVGLRFTRPLRIAALEQLLRLCRGEPQPAAATATALPAYA